MPVKIRPKANVVVVDHRNIVGIDIGKRKHAATAITPKGAVIASLSPFENNKEGVDLLEREVLVPATGRSKPLIALEATGMYWCALHDELSRRGYNCVVLNPIQTNRHGPIPRRLRERSWPVTRNRPSYRMSRCTNFDFSCDIVGG